MAAGHNRGIIRWHPDVLHPCHLHEMTRDVGRMFGLEINEGKSMIMIYKGKTGVKELEGIKVEDSIKYLGV